MTVARVDEPKGIANPFSRFSLGFQSRKFFIKHAQDVCLRSFVSETGDDLDRESACDELSGSIRMNAARAKVENFLFADLGTGAAVTAFHIIRIDFQARH